MRVLVAAVAAIAFATIATCGRSGGTITGEVPPRVVVLVSAGTTPFYSWTGPLAASIDVARVSNPSIAVWGIESLINRNIVSGTQHGVVPAGSTPTATAELTLTTGVRYRVTVALVDGTSGSVDFTP